MARATLHTTASGRFRCEPVARIVKRPVKFVDDCIGEAAERAVAAMRPGDIVCLENTRFYPGEEKNDPAFVASLARLGDIWVSTRDTAGH